MTGDVITGAELRACGCRRDSWHRPECDGPHDEAEGRELAEILDRQALAGVVTPKVLAEAFARLRAKPPAPYHQHVAHPRDVARGGTVQCAGCGEAIAIEPGGRVVRA